MNKFVVLTDKCPFYMNINKKLGKYGFLLMQGVFMPPTCSYILVRLVKQGRRSQAFVLSEGLSHV
jgi:hypothetical protein